MQRTTDEKRALRRQARGVLQSLPPSIVEGASAAVRDHLSELFQLYPQPEYPYALGFVPWFPGEVQLGDFYRKERDRQWGFPHLESTDEMRFRLVGHEWYRRVTERTGDRPPEPRGDEGPEYTAAAAAQTIIIVPGLAFDREGYRLGRGKSYYDRFLNSPGMQAAIRIGVCLPEQLVEQVPRESHDAQLDYVIAGAQRFRTARNV